MNEYSSFSLLSPTACGFFCSADPVSRSVGAAKVGLGVAVTAGADSTSGVAYCKPWSERCRRREGDGDMPVALK